MKASDMRTGMAVMFDGALYICVHATHVTPGNLRAFVQAKLKRISDGVIIEKRLHLRRILSRRILTAAIWNTCIPTTPDMSSWTTRRMTR